MNSNGPMTMQEIRDAMEARLVHEKGRLVAALAEQLDDDGERVACEFGARGRLSSSGLPGTFHVNCNREGRSWASVGRGKGQLSHYLWIPIVYRDGENTASYVLSLCQEDLDVKTGNVHACPGRLQFTRSVHDGPEVGGQANPRPVPVEGGYLLNYCSDSSFPRAIRDYGKDCQPRTVLDDDRPWGCSGFEGQIPALDLADPAYDPQEAAAFFMRLILRHLGA